MPGTPTRSIGDLCSHFFSWLRRNKEPQSTIPPPALPKGLSLMAFRSVPKFPKTAKLLIEWLSGWVRPGGRVYLPITVAGGQQRPVPKGLHKNDILSFRNIRQSDAHTVLPLQVRFCSFAFLLSVFPLCWQRDTLCC